MRKLSARQINIKDRLNIRWGKKMREEDKTKEQLISELAELRQTKTLFQALFEYDPDAIVVVNSEGKIVQINSQAEKMFGYSREEVLGSKVEIFVPERFREQHAKQLRNYMLKPRIRLLGTDLELYGRRRDGSEFPVDIMLGPLETEEGTLVLGIVRDISEHKRMDQELRLLLTLTQAINEAKDLNAAMEVTLRKVCEATGWDYGEVWVPDPEGKAYVCSPVWYSSKSSLEKFRRLSESFTYSPGQGLPGRVWSSKQPEWIPDVSIAPDAVYPRIEAAKEAGLKAGLGIPIIADGQVLAVLVFLMFEFDEKDGQLVEVVLAIATQLGSLIQRKKMEDALLASEVKYRSIFENAAEGIFKTAVNGSIQAANPALARLLGYASPQELISDVADFRKLYAEPGRRLEFVRLIQAFGAVSDFEVQVRKKDGSKIWILMNARALRDVRGNIIGYEGMAMDITNRKRAAKNFERLIESAPDAIITVDRNFNILFVNTRAEKIFGYTREELLDKSYDILVPLRFREKHAGNCAGYFAEPTIKTMALHMGALAKRKDGSEFPVEINMGPIETEQGITVLTFIRDVSERIVPGIPYKNKR